MTAVAMAHEVQTNSVLDGIARMLGRAEVAVWGTGPSAPMETERAGHRPSDVLSGARSVICFGIPVPRGVFERQRVVETNWRVQGLYYRRLDDLSVRVAAKLEEAGERAVPIFGCLPVVLRGSSSIAGYMNQIRMGEVTRIGTRGRNGLLFHPRHGSRLMLGGVVTTATLPPRTEPQPVVSGCPVDCRRCADACPIQAIRPEQRIVDDACLRFTSRTPLLPRVRYLLLSRMRRRKAARLLSATSVDEHTLHVCSRCVSACPVEAGAGVTPSTRCNGGVTAPSGPTQLAGDGLRSQDERATASSMKASPTNGYARPVSAPALLRLGLVAAGAVAPALAARAAERLFLSPPRRRPSRRERDAIAGGDGFALAVKGETVRAWRFGGGPPVLLVHGWGGRGGQLAAFIPPLLSAGCSAVAFDAPAHGGSTGHLASGVTFAEAVSAIAESVGARAAIGHSMGATALGWTVAHGLRLDAAVLLGPPRGAAGFFQQFCDALALGQPMRSALRSRIERRYGIAPEAFDLASRAGGASTPLLVFHDRGDREVPWTDGDAIARAWPGAALVTTEGLGHRGILRDSSVAGRAVAFLLDHMSRCACGRLASHVVGSRICCEGCALDHELYDRYLRSASA